MLNAAKELTEESSAEQISNAIASLSAAQAALEARASQASIDALAATVANAEALRDQYTSEAFREELCSLGIIQSLSGAGHCFDNARKESFFATLKKEKIYKIAAYKLTRAQVKTVVLRYIFTYYNRIRICSVNPGGLLPVKYRDWVAALDFLRFAMLHSVNPAH